MISKEEQYGFDPEAEMVKADRPSSSPLPGMSPELFRELEQKLMRHADSILQQRSISYGNPLNALENFDNIARQADVAPELVWIILWQKGLQTITKLMRGEDVPGEMLEERFSDAINYLKLGYALKMRSLQAKEGRDHE